MHRPPIWLNETSTTMLSTRNLRSLTWHQNATGNSACLNSRSAHSCEVPFPGAKTYKRALAGTGDGPQGTKEQEIRRKRAVQSSESGMPE